jgi:hypothetical protein
VEKEATESDTTQFPGRNRADATIFPRASLHIELHGTKSCLFNQNCAYPSTLIGQRAVKKNCRPAPISGHRHEQSDANYAMAAPAPLDLTIHSIFLVADLERRLDISASGGMDRQRSSVAEHTEFL